MGEVLGMRNREGRGGKEENPGVMFHGFAF